MLDRFLVKDNKTFSQYYDKTLFSMSTSIGLSFWSNSGAPYYADIRDESIKANKKYIIDINLSSNSTDVRRELDEFYKINKAESFDGYIRLYCFFERPTISQMSISVQEVW